MELPPDAGADAATATPSRPASAGPATLASAIAVHLRRAGFRRLTVSNRHGTTRPFRKAVLRRVALARGEAFQLVTYDSRASFTRIVEGPADPTVATVLAGDFEYAVVDLEDERIELRQARSGRLLTRRGPAQGVELGGHDRRKSHPIQESADFLRVLGLASGGHVKPTRQAKYRQINELVRLVDTHALHRLVVGGRPLRVVDLGCGNASLTFAVHHHLSRSLGIDCLVVGVDRDRGLVERARHRAEELSATGLSFVCSCIEDYEPDQPPEVVLALHACDTATDYALAAMVGWRAGLGLVAPCCHHHLQGQLRPARLDRADALVVRHPLLRERAGDLLTDAARATLLRLAGYSVEAVEFVSPDHTPRNLALRVIDRQAPPPPGLAEAYLEFTRRWAIRPLLADLVPEIVQPAITAEGELHA